MRGSRAYMSFGVVTIVLVFAACDKPAPPQQAPPVAQAAARDATFEQDSLRDWFIESGVSDVPGTEEEIVGAFGAPDSVVRLASANAQDPMSFDTIIEIHYKAMSATILKVGANELLQSVWVADSAHLAGPVRLGTDTSELRRLFGAPMIGGEHPGYVCGKCSSLNESVQFDLAGGRVTGLTFSFPDGG